MTPPLASAYQSPTLWEALIPDDAEGWIIFIGAIAVVLAAIGTLAWKAICRLSLKRLWATASSFEVVGNTAYLQIATGGFPLRCTLMHVVLVDKYGLTFRACGDTPRIFVLGRSQVKIDLSGIRQDHEVQLYVAHYSGDAFQTQPYRMATGRGLNFMSGGPPDHWQRLTLDPRPWLVWSPDGSGEELKGVLREPEAPKTEAPVRPDDSTGPRSGFLRRLPGWPERWKRQQPKADA